MVIVVRLLGLLIAVMGLVFLVNPNTMKRYVAFWREERRLYIGSLLSVLIGINLLQAAPLCRWVWFVVVLGIWSLIKGVLILIYGTEKMAAKIDWWGKRSPAVIRIFAVFALVIGALFIYSV